VGETPLHNGGGTWPDSPHSPSPPVTHNLPHHTARDKTFPCFTISRLGGLALFSGGPGGPSNRYHGNQHIPTIRSLLSRPRPRLALFFSPALFSPRHPFNLIRVPPSFLYVRWGGHTSSGQPLIHFPPIDFFYPPSPVRHIKTGARREFVITGANSQGGSSKRGIFPGPQTTRVPTKIKKTGLGGKLIGE